MAKEDIKEYFEIYQKFLMFTVTPEKIISFSNKKKGWNFFISIMTFFILNSILFSLLISFLNTKKFVTKWVPALMFIQSIIYIPVCVIPALTTNIKTMMKIAITEALIVLSTLLYINITIYLLFLFTEFYVFYYLYLAISVLTTIYLCLYYPMKVAKNKQVFFGILTFFCSFGINYLSTSLILSMNPKPIYVMVDKIYQESIEKTEEIIELSQYCINHQLVINDLQTQYLNSGDSEVLRLLNNQLNLILLKKNDIAEYKDKIIFNRNKHELISMIDILDLYELLKREINVYEYISDEYHKILCEYFENDDDNKSLEALKTIGLSEDQYKKFQLNLKTMEEINTIAKNINLKIEKLSEQIDETQKFWSKRQKFLL